MKRGGLHSRELQERRGEKKRVQKRRKEERRRVNNLSCRREIREEKKTEMKNLLKKE